MARLHWPVSEDPKKLQGHDHPWRAGETREWRTASLPRRRSPVESGVPYKYKSSALLRNLQACGCGKEVVTPIRPNKWTLSFDGESVSLSPSIGSWSLECQSHYFIRKNRIRWVPPWQPKE